MRGLPRNGEGLFVATLITGPNPPGEQQPDREQLQEQEMKAPLSVAHLHLVADRRRNKRPGSCIANFRSG